MYKRQREEHEAEREIDDIRRGRRLQSYIEERARAGDYRSQLGIVAQVRKDFTKLAELMDQARLARQKPRAKAGETSADVAELEDLPPIDRIVLYIDDLDRCPTDRVVQVLEAVHLLLALPLFVVVVGVDSRWLMQSLRHHYAAQLRGPDAQAFTRVEDRSYWESTPQNYLEKIFQIPFSIRGMDKTGFEQLMGKLFKPADRNDNAAAEAVAAAGPRATAGSSQTEPEVDGSPAPPGRPSNAGTDEGQQPVPRSATPAPASDARVSTRPSRPSRDRPPPTDAGTGHATEPTSDQDTADRPIDAPPEALSISSDELQFLQSLADFIPTPRAAKRLANTYRLIRVLLTPAEYAEYTSSTDQHYKVVLTLLGVLVGFPEQATIVFEEILTTRIDDWPTFKAKIIDTAGRTERPSQLEAENGQSGEVPRSNGADPPTAVTRDETWGRLSSALRDLDAAMSLPSSMSAYREWARNISRYSFHTGRLASLVADDGDESSKADRSTHRAEGSALQGERG